MWTQILSRKDGMYTVCYKLYNTDVDLAMSLLGGYPIRSPIPLEDREWGRTLNMYSVVLNFLILIKFASEFDPA